MWLQEYRVVIMEEQTMKSYDCSTKGLREEYGMTQKDLADYFYIPLRTVQEWDEKRTCPIYVWNMMDRILEDAFQKYPDLF